VLDDYVYATTSPIYVNIIGSSPGGRDDAAFFVSWIDRLEEAARSNRDWNTESEKATVLHTLDQARQVYISLQR
jgi:TolB protein